MQREQEKIPLLDISKTSYGSTTSGKTASNSSLSKNSTTSYQPIYAVFFKQAFKKDFPDTFNFSMDIAGGDINTFKF